jgi:hypothetical protein
MGQKYTTDDTLERKIEDFNNAWVAFLKEWYHCPDELTDLKDCKPALGSINYKAWSAASKKASALFGKQDPK